jgi:ribonuclease VapC
VIIDSSALVAILRAESDRERFMHAIERASARLIATPTLLETTLVLVGNRRDEMLDALDDFIRLVSIKTVPFTADHAAVARQAFMKYGKGRNHPAALNFGDCISYATAKLEMMPLLFKGDDFRLTDIEPAL